MKYMIIARVNGIEYLTKVDAESALQAEHIALDRGVYAAGQYGCDACMAYDAKSMKTDCFIGASLWAEPISLEGLMDKIDQNNRRLQEKASRAQLIKDIKAAIKLQQEAVDAANRQLLEMQTALAEANRLYAAS